MSKSLYTIYFLGNTPKEINSKIQEVIKWPIYQN